MAEENLFEVIVKTNKNTCAISFSKEKSNTRCMCDKMRHASYFFEKKIEKVLFVLVALKNFRYSHSFFVFMLMALSIHVDGSTGRSNSTTVVSSVVRYSVLPFRAVI